MKFPMITSILSMVVFRIGLSYVIGVGLGLGALGVWIAMVVDWIARVSCFVGRYKSGNGRIWQRFRGWMLRRKICVTCLLYFSDNGI